MLLAGSKRELEELVARVIREVYPPPGTSGVRPKPSYLAEQIVAALEAHEAGE